MELREYAEKLAHADALRRNGGAKDSIRVCEELLAAFPGDLNARHLLGISLRDAGALGQAQAELEAVAAADPANHECFNNLASVYEQLGDFERAVNAYRDAVRINPLFTDGWVNLALMLSDRNRMDEAIEAARAAIDTNPNSPKAQRVYARILTTADRLDDALAQYKTTLELNPGDFLAFIGYAVALRKARRVDEALAVLQQVEQTGLKKPDLSYAMATTYFDLGETQRAIDYARDAIHQNPGFVDAHASLNKILWQHEYHDDYLKSYAWAIDQASSVLQLRLDYTSELIRHDRYDEALGVVKEAMKRFPDQPALFGKLGVILDSGFSDYPEAIKARDRSVELAPNSAQIRLGRTETYLHAGDPEKALLDAQIAHELAPRDQRIIAYLGLCWRALNDPRHDWLNDYEQFARPIQLERPDGYDSIEAFIADLEPVLVKLHRASVQPAEQSLMHGTQTEGDIFNKTEEPIIQLLKRQLEIAVAEYITDLPDDPDHPFLQRKSDRFYFSGGWSVRLKSQGYHVDHIHEGWISSAFYVAVPDSVGSSADKQGWIKFGENDVLAAPHNSPRKFIKPEPGLLALFPSYMWHGTVPYESDSHRMTVAFDVVEKS